MGGFGIDSGREEGDLSWTNELLPIEVRRALLDKALEDLRVAKAAASMRRDGATPERPGQSGAGRDIQPRKDKPNA